MAYKKIFMVPTLRRPDAMNRGAVADDSLWSNDLGMLAQICSPNYS